MKTWAFIYPLFNIAAKDFDRILQKNTMQSLLLLILKSLPLSPTSPPHPPSVPSPPSLPHPPFNKFIVLSSLSKVLVYLLVIVLLMLIRTQGQTHPSVYWPGQITFHLIWKKIGFAWRLQNKLSPFDFVIFCLLFFFTTTNRLCCI